MFKCEPAAAYKAVVIRLAHFAGGMGVGFLGVLTDEHLLGRIPLEIPADALMKFPVSPGSRGIRVAGPGGAESVLFLRDFGWVTLLSIAIILPRFHHTALRPAAYG